MAPLVSIIIPFHNEGQYLDRAVVSAVTQSYTDIEVILVNDASTDHSLLIATTYKEKYDNVQVISINAQSLGAARNAGIAISQGYYICFLDADDVLETDAIALLYNDINENKSDAVIGKFSILNAANIAKNRMGWRLDGKLKTGEEAALAMYQYQIVYTVWAKLFKASIVKQIPFVTGLWFEDRVFMLPYFLRSEQISFVDKCVLQYQSRPNSITRRIISEKRITDIFKVYMLELAAIKGHPQEPTLMRVIDRHEINAFIETLIFLYFDKNKVENLKALQQCFDINLSNFTRQLKINQSGIGKRDRLDLLLLKLYSIVGWTITFKLVSVFKKKKCSAILALRAS